MKRTPIRGIVVAGNSLEEAQSLYRAVATGQSVAAYHDSEETFVVLSSTDSNIDILNPLTGADDLVVGDGLTEQMEFLSSSSPETVDTNYTICVAGCGAHILADDEELMQHCPACASALEMLDEDQIESLSGGEDEGGECTDCQESVLASGATFEEAVASFRGLVAGEIEPVHMQADSDVIVAVAGNASFNIYSGDNAELVEDYVPSILESIASTSDSIEAHHFVCSSSTCDTPHVISSDEMPVFCPSCASGLLDPEDEELDEDIEEELDEDIEEEDDVEEDDSDSDEDDIEEEEDDSDSDEDDIEEDDSDDSDSDDEDEDDEDDEDEDEMTLSVSSVRTVRRGRNKAVASSAPMTSVDVSFLSVASAGGELDVSSLDVVYAGNVHGDNTWFAMYNGVPVAKACASTTKHTEIFNSEVFGRAFKAQASEHGILAALENMGFEGIKTQVEIPEYVKSEVEAQVSEREAAIAANFQRDRDELHDRFNAAMSLAATGISKGFFKGKLNPIQQSLITSLSAVGIDNADALVAKAFSSHSDEYHKLLLAQASNIMSYNLETQNQLAEAIRDSNDVRDVATASSAPVTLGRPVQVEKEEAIAASNPQGTDFNNLMSQVVMGLGKRR